MPERASEDYVTGEKGGLGASPIVCNKRLAAYSVQQTTNCLPRDLAASCPAPAGQAAGHVAGKLPRMETQ